MSDRLVIALDAMGGDKAPEVVIDGAEIARERFPDISFLMFGELSEHLEAVKRPIFCQEINKYLKYIWKFF